VARPQNFKRQFQEGPFGRLAASQSFLGVTVACSYLASDLVVLVLSEAVLSETVLVLDVCLNFGDADL
jgi:hypothetical protein